MIRLKNRFESDVVYLEMNYFLTKRTGKRKKRRGMKLELPVGSTVVGKKRYKLRKPKRLTRLRLTWCSEHDASETSNPGRDTWPFECHLSTCEECYNVAEV